MLKKIYKRLGLIGEAEHIKEIESYLATARKAQDSASAATSQAVAMAHMIDYYRGTLEEIARGEGENALLARKALTTQAFVRPPISF